MLPNKAKTPWHKLVDKKQQQLKALIPAEYLLPNSPSTEASSTNVLSLVANSVSYYERQITELPLHSLLNALCQGQLTSQEVLAAFFHRAVIAHQLTSCLSEIHYLAAQRRAQELDAYWRCHRSPIGPLHGLPVSLMDRFHVAQLDSACGFASWTGNARSESDEGALVASLRRLGAVIYCKTAVPMSMMMGETANNLTGNTTNPYNVRLSAGGACGGEGALIACHGSPLGICTDVAGSSRIPSAWNGIWALKCSEERLPISGVATILSGLPICAGAVGILSSDLEGLVQVFQALLGANLPSDASTINIPWQSAMYDDIRQRIGLPEMPLGRLCLGFMPCDGHVRPHPAILRGLELAKAALIQGGHEIVDWNPPPHAPAVENLFKIFGSTCMAEARAAIDASGEPPVPQVRDWYENGDVGPTTTNEFWRLCVQRTEYRAAYATYMASVAGATKTGRTIDGILLPVAPTTAVQPGKFNYYGYSAIANVLDFAAGTVPIAFGDEALDFEILPSPSLTGTDHLMSQTFDTGSVQGMPIALQVMCPRLHEERVLALMQVIFEAVRR